MVATKHLCIWIRVCQWHISWHLRKPHAYAHIVPTCKRSNIFVGVDLIPAPRRPLLPAGPRRRRQWNSRQRKHFIQFDGLTAHQRHFFVNTIKKTMFPCTDVWRAFRFSMSVSCCGFLACGCIYTWVTWKKYRLSKRLCISAKSKKTKRPKVITAMADARRENCLRCGITFKHSALRVVSTNDRGAARQSSLG